MRLIVGSLSLLLSFSSLTAQISVPQDTVQKLFTVGNPLRIYGSTGAESSVDVGLKGGNRVYDFSSVGFVLFKVDTVRQVSSIPYLASRFPAETFAITFSDTEEKKKHGLLGFQGNELNIPGDYEQHKADSVKVVHHNPYELFLKFPVAYGDSIARTSTITDSIFGYGGSVYIESRDIPTHYVVDGWGILRLPGGEEHQCLRVRWYEQPGNFHYKSFRYVTDSGIILHIDTRNDQADEGIVKLTGPVLQFRNTEAAVVQSITVEKSHLETMFAAGKRIHIWGVDKPTMVDVGRKGGPNVYDFSQLDYPDQGAPTVFRVSEVPFLAPRFPANALTFRGFPTDIENNTVLLFEGDALYNLADVYIDVDSQRIQHRIPAPPIGRFPATFGMEWEYSYTNAETTFVNNQITETASWEERHQLLIDGFGVLRLPNGFEFECLRLTNTEKPPGGGREFLYLTREGVVFSVRSDNSESETGVVAAYQTRLVVPEALVSVPRAESSPTDFSLSQNYPNPFNPATTISFSLPAKSLVSLRIFDILGREVAVLISDILPAGTHSRQWNAERVSSGVYFYRLQAGTFSETKKLLLLR